MVLARRTILSALIAQVLFASVPAVAQTAAPSAGNQAATPPTQDAGAPQAQDSVNLEGVTVSGIRQSLEKSRDLKKDSSQIVDAIVADDIGKLPDSNVAESLGRVAGVQLERGMGEGSNILVRGLSQNVYLYNGREIFDATGRGGNGLDQLNTSTYGLLTLVPSQVISRLSVTKLASADQVSGALGGIVNIETRMPLNADGDQNVVSVSGTYSKLARKGGGSGFALLSGRNKDETFGAMVAATYSHATVVQQGLDTFSGYSQFTDGAGVKHFGSTDMRAQNIDDDRTRKGVSAVLQWRPTPGVEIVGDTFYSKQTADRDRYWLAFNPSAGLSNATYSNHNILLAGRATTPVQANTEIADIEADVWSTALRGSFHAGDHLDGSAEISYDRSKAEYRQNYMRLQPRSGITSVIDYDLRSGNFGSFNIGGVNLNDPNQMAMSILFDNDYRAKTDAPAARTDWVWNFDSDHWQSLSFGARATRIKSDQDPSRADIRPAGGVPATALADYLRVYSNNDFMKGEFDGLPRSFLGSYRSVFTGCDAFTNLPAISQNAQCLDGRNNALAYAGTFSIEEKFTEAYTKADWSFNAGNMPVSGNFGVRYVQRELDSSGNLITGTGQASPSEYRSTTREWLPSFIAKWEITDQLLVRGGAARVVAFPNTEDLNNGVSLNNTAVFVNGVQVTPGTGSGGAPGLKPFKADQYDLSLEYYYNDTGMVSAGLFYKDVSTFIVQKQSAENIGGVNYFINRKVNGDSAKVQGAELLAQVPFTFLPDPLDGFGMVATYTYIDSRTPVKDVNGSSLTFPGLSKNNYNLIVYYEKGPFSTRVAYNWRNRYLVGLSTAATGIYNDTYKDLAASVSYNFTPQLSLQVEATNLLNSRQRTFDGYEEGLRTNVIYGRNYMATVTWRF